MPRRLAYLQSKSSVVVDAPLKDVWKVCRAWGRQPWMPLLPDGTPFDVSVQGNSTETEIGAIRCSKFGDDCQIFEQLVALDDEHTTMSWRSVEHKDTVSPFEHASFVSFRTTLTLQSVSISDQTFVEWEGSWYTEPEYAASMQETLDFWYAGGMSSLKSYAAHHMAKKQQYNRMEAQNFGRMPDRSWGNSEAQGRDTRGASSQLSQSQARRHPQHRPTY